MPVTDNPTNAELRVIRSSHKLKHKDIAEMTQSARVTVKAWFRDPTNLAYRRMPASKLELLKLKLPAGEVSRRGTTAEVFVVDDGAGGQS